ncbi:type II toxin-antitoxin system RelE/ParE family toxin [Vreelandella neptunia]|uniref:Toxin n=1 Tax=Vreelandella neptunia TaxID=115551 RepID=A0ABZ0YGS2_9GAMM|nr:type II toxin-antitoxin system RelE/ParE family toxin [Halomonas neptunia]MDN3561172.1 type II toxin-antitoxin system RelE/ParE family toxin [Halomonas neptunia]TDW00226.1 toxin ParE1/3/4 [Halomonas alkaliantarctica]WQH11307.1 type II toxin-antitoxin system RelE/ParE family toxin [Halomonas neptunia]
MYKLSNLAAEDFASIYEYTLLNFGALQADAYTDNLESTFRLLSGSPLMGYECPEIADGIRRHDHQRHVIFYRQREQYIFVIRILHQQMEPLKHVFEL